MNPHKGFSRRNAGFSYIKQGDFRLLRNPLHPLIRVKHGGTQAKRPADVESSETSWRDFLLHVSLGTTQHAAF